MPGGHGRGLPAFAELGQESCAAGARLGRSVLAGVAVHPHRAGAEPHGGRRLAGGEGAGEEPRHLQAAVHERLLPGGGPRPFAHVLAGEGDQGVGPFERGGIELAGRGVPAELAGAGVAAHELDHLVPAREEEGGELGAEQAGGAGEHDAQLRLAGVPREVFEQAPAAEGEHGGEARIHPEAGDGGREFDLVVDHGPAVAVFDEAVGVPPRGEGPARHLVHKPFRDRVVNGLPEHAGRHAHHEAVALAHGADLLDHLHRFPGREQALEGARSFVPGAYLGGRKGEWRVELAPRRAHGRSQAPQPGQLWMARASVVSTTRWVGMRVWQVWHMFSTVFTSAGRLRWRSCA